MIPQAISGIRCASPPPRGFPCGLCVGSGVPLAQEGSRSRRARICGGDRRKLPLKSRGIRLKMDASDGRGVRACEAMALLL
eukprot:scaffold1311_cov256-Pinguiococcus_pyrenoidosus.AAC.59